MADDTCVIDCKCQSEGMLERWNGQPDTQKPEADSGFCCHVRGMFVRNVQTGLF